MREIKFRGKLMEGADMWVYGSLINNAFQKDADKSTILYIFDHNNFGYFDCWEDIAERIDEFRVFPESVGMFTGLKDVDGTEIYEGDVLHIIGQRHNWNAFVEWNQQAAAFWLRTIPTRHYTEFGKLAAHGDETGTYIESARIIGNIFANPELLTPSTGEGLK